MDMSTGFSAIFIGVSSGGCEPSSNLGEGDVRALMGQEWYRPEER